MLPCVQLGTDVQVLRPGTSTTQLHGKALHAVAHVGWLPCAGMHMHACCWACILNALTDSCIIAVCASMLGAAGHPPMQHWQQLVACAAGSRRSGAPCLVLHAMVG